MRAERSLRVEAAVQAILRTQPLATAPARHHWSWGAEVRRSTARGAHRVLPHRRVIEDRRLQDLHLVVVDDALLVAFVLAAVEQCLDLPGCREAAPATPFILPWGGLDRDTNSRRRAFSHDEISSGRFRELHGGRRPNPEALPALCLLLTSPTSTPAPCCRPPLVDGRGRRTVREPEASGTLLPQNARSGR